MLILKPATGAGQELFVSGVSPHFAWGAYNSGQTDAFCFSSNKAALARCRNLSIALSGERPYNTSRLGRYRLALVLPAGPGTFGLEAGFVSSAPYRESLAGIAYGRKLGKAVSIGMQCGFASMALPAYPAASVITGSASVILHLTAQVNAGWSLSVPYQVDKVSARPGIPLQYSMGIGFDPGPAWSAALELKRGPSSGIAATLGFVYKPHPLISIKMGCATAGPPIWFGCGYRLKQFALHLSMSVHDRLGLSPALGLLRTFEKKE